MRRNPIIFNSLVQRNAGIFRTVQFLEGEIQVSRTKKLLKLNAESTPERSECRYQNHGAIPAVGGDITLRQKIVAIGNGLPPSQCKSRQRLTENQVEIGVGLE